MCALRVDGWLHSDDAREWINERLVSEGWQWLGVTLWVDGRFADEVLAGLVEAGLLVVAE